MIAAAPAAAGRGDVLPGPLQGQVLNVLDGDTVVVRLRVWLGQDVETSVRIAGIDAPEMKSRCADERRRAQAAKTALARLLADGRISLRDIRLEKYAGRVLAVAETAQGQSIAKTLLDQGYARPYHGEKRGPWCS